MQHTKPGSLEAISQTAFRENILSSLVEKLDDVDLFLLTGSLAWGANRWVTKNSDIDIIITANKFPELLRNGSAYSEFATQLFDKKKVDLVSFPLYLSDVTTVVQAYHNDAFHQACRFEIPSFKRLTYKPTSKRSGHRDFWGVNRYEPIKRTRQEEGFIERSPVYTKKEGRFVPHFPLCNLITPVRKIKSNKELEYSENIFWKEISNRLGKEAGPIVDLEKTNVGKTQIVYERLSFADQNEIQRKTKENLIALGYKVKNYSSSIK